MPSRQPYPIERNLTNHPPQLASTVESMELVRSKAKELADTIDLHVADSRERSLAFTNLEQCVMWAVGALARADYDEYLVKQATKAQMEAQ